MIIYLYIKRHKKTGLKYLGTTWQNPYTYKGSGSNWVRHLKEHGNHQITCVIAECKTNEEAKALGIHYSELYDVVNDIGWANKVPESGQGRINSGDSEYDWINDDGRVERCTKRLLSQKYDLPPNKLIEIVNGKRKSIYGWRLKSMTGLGFSKHNRDPNIYHYRHDSGVEEHCSQYDLYTKYGLKQLHVSSITKGGRRRDGWIRVTEECYSPNASSASS